MPLLGVDEAHHQLHDGAGRVELAALLAGRVGKVTDQVLVGGAEQVGKLEIVVAEPVPREVVDEVPPLLVRNGCVTDPPVEVDVLQHPLQRGIALLEPAKSPVQRVAHLIVNVLVKVRPAGLGWYEEPGRVEVRVVGSLLCGLFRTAPCDLVLDDQPPFLLENVASPLQEQSTEDVLLELRRVHLPPQDVGSSKKMPFKLAKCEHQPRIERLAPSCVAGVLHRPGRQVDHSDLAGRCYVVVARWRRGSWSAALWRLPAARLRR